MVFGWLGVAKFWWKVLCGFAGESDRKIERKE